MRTSLIVAFLSLFLFGKTQDSTTTYTLKEIGWTIKLPSSFTVMSAAENEAVIRRGAGAVKQSTGLGSDLSATKTLITATKGRNYFSATLTQYDPKKDGSFSAVLQRLKGVITKTFEGQMPGASVDTSTTVARIDSIMFDRFRVSIKGGGVPETVLDFYSALYKGHNFMISLIYADDKTYAQMEEMLSTSTFSK